MATSMKFILSFILTFILSLIFPNFIYAEEPLLPGIKIFESRAVGEPLIKGESPSNIIKRTFIKEPLQFKSPQIKKEFLPPLPKTREFLSKEIQTLSASMGSWNAYIVNWDLAGRVTSARWIPIYDQMYVHVTDGAISVSRVFPAPRATGTYYYTFFFDNNRGATLSIDWKYVVVSSSYVELWSSVNKGPYNLYYSGYPYFSYLILESGLLLAAANVGFLPDDVLEQYIIGTWTVTETSPAFSGVIGKFDVRMLAVKNLKPDPYCFNPAGYDAEDPNTPRWFTVITGDIFALPRITELFPNGWHPLGDIQWLITIEKDSLLQSYQGSSLSASPDINGKVASFKQKWFGDQASTQEKAPAGKYAIFARALGLTTFFPLYAANTITRWKANETKVALHVPYFNQARRIDPAWGSVTYDGYPEGTPGKTLASQGCAVTSAAMILKYYGIDTSPEGKPTNPATLNDWLNRNDGYEKVYKTGVLVESSIRWVAALDWYSIGMVKALSEEVNGEQLTQELLDATPPILRVPRYNPHHFVVATAQSKDTWTINDPALWSSFPYHTLTLKERDFGNSYEFMIKTRRSVIPYPYFAKLVVFLGSEGELLLIDPQGRRYGYDPLTKTKVREIPNAAYITTGGLIDPLTLEIPKTKIKELWVNEVPAAGVYTLEVIGIEQEEATLDVTTTTSQKRTIISKRIMLAPGKILRYKIDIKGGAIPTEVKEVTVDIPGIRQAVQSAYQAGKIKTFGLMTSLVQKLDAAEEALNRKQITVVKNILNAFINEVEAQKGKLIDETIANSLIVDTNEFITQLK